MGYLLCWAAGLLLCAIAAGIVLYMLVKGISYLRPSLLLQSPQASPNQSGSGGFLDPIEGTLLLTAIGIALAAPIGVAVAVWLSEYRRPAGLARAVESGIEMIAGAPSVVLAFFGLLVFARPALAFLSQTSAGGAVYGRSFFAAGAMMSLLALPLVVAATREGLAQIPAHVREASYALGKTAGDDDPPGATALDPPEHRQRRDARHGTDHRRHRDRGDPAGSSLRLEGAGGAPLLSTLRGTGGTLTSYVYENSPAGEGNAPQKAYAAAFVLLMMVLALNMVVTRLSSERPLFGLTPAMAWGWMPWTR